MEELSDYSCVLNENEKCTTIFKNEEDIWNNTSSQFYASTDYYINNFTNISELEKDDAQLLKKSTKFDSVFDEKPLKNPFVVQNPSIEKRVFFIISKRHTYKCKHLSNISKSFRKNKIKLSLENDFNLLLSTNMTDFKNTFHCFKKKIIPLKSFEKSTKNRKFRLFDKDVIIKKVICHFYKFISCMINLIEKEVKVKINLNDIIKQKKKSQSCFRKILWMKICELEGTGGIYNQNIKMFLSLTFLEIYNEFFLNSHYFQQITENFKTRHGDYYYQYFINLCSDFPNSIYLNIKNNLNNHKKTN